MKHKEHKDHEVMTFNEKLVKEGKEPNVRNEGIMYCETCKEEFIKCEVTI